VPTFTIGRGDIDVEMLAALDDAGGASLLFLHEGLGANALWRRFPYDVRDATGRTTILYSRHGHGRSTPVTEARPPGYMHDEALTVLPELLDQLALDRPLLVGHSDGASIAIIYAGSRLGPVAGLVLLAPHVFVEDRSVAGIQEARTSYLTTDLPSRMAKYHVDADATFWGWNRVWLSPEFRSWDITEYLAAIDCPVLVVQGEDDEYGTLAQVDAIEAGLGGDSFERLVLAGCGHSPHLDRPLETTEAVVRFVKEHP
jgi:pimeloyl-ACP methyl ester carboxylesterase